MDNFSWENFIAQLAGGRHTLCLVGGGGKTTVMYELAAKLAARGRKVLVLTSTHIMQPAPAVLAENVAAALSLWQQKQYAVIGTPEAVTGKLTAPAPALYSALSRAADVVLCEADGAKHYPTKAPAAHEPVLLNACDVVLAVCGMDALGKPLAQVCLRAQLAAELLGVSENALLTAEHLARLLTDERGARKNVGSRAYYVLLNKCDLVEKNQVEAVRKQLTRQGLSAAQLLTRGNFVEEERK